MTQFGVASQSVYLLTLGEKKRWSNPWIRCDPCAALGPPTHTDTHRHKYILQQNGYETLGHPPF